MWDVKTARRSPDGEIESCSIALYAGVLRTWSHISAFLQHSHSSSSILLSYLVHRLLGFGATAIGMLQHAQITPSELVADNSKYFCSPVRNLSGWRFSLLLVLCSGLAAFGGLEEAKGRRVAVEPRGLPREDIGHGGHCLARAAIKSSWRCNDAEEDVVDSRKLK